MGLAFNTKMTLEQLRIFLAVAEYMHFTRAANDPRLRIIRSSSLSKTNIRSSKGIRPNSFSLLLNIFKVRSPASGRRTIVIVLHDLNQGCRYADYIVAMRQGRIVTVGNPVEVMTEETVKQVFGLDCLIISDPVAGTPVCVPLGRKLHVIR